MKPYIVALFLLAPVHVLAASFSSDFANAAIERTQHTVRYDGRYISIPYPNGDVPSDTGVCTDVVIRAYRKIGSDLQRLVHEDMASFFDQYPSKRMWGLTHPDKNIDHRRVPNLQAFFKRHGEVLKASQDFADYQAGDLITWILPGNLPHIGIVTDKTAPRTGAPLIAHNIARGPELQDMMFDYQITGHYRYMPLSYR